LGHLQLGYIGSTFKVDTSTLITFCLTKGGTTTANTDSTQYNDCGWSVIYDQNGTGCDISQTSTTHMPPVQIRISDGEPALIQPATIGPASSPASKYPYATGCTLVTGRFRAARSSCRTTPISACCGQQGSVEDPAPTGMPPAGSMWSATYYHNGRAIDFGADVEGGGACVSSTPIALTPVADGVGITTYSGATNKTNTYYNNLLLGPTNCTPQKTINTQSGMIIGCSGDHASCGPVYFRDMIFATNDVSVISGLPAAIYNYLIRHSPSRR
jgi:hypothetical protein